MTDFRDAREAHVPPAARACDREPIHIPGAIQPFGVLLAVEPGARAVRHVSENCAALLGKRPDELLGLSLREAVGEAAEAALRAAWETREGERSPVPVALASGEAQAHVHVQDGLVLIELEPGSDLSLPHRTFASAVSRLQAITELPALFAAAVTEVRRISGFERVLLYRFDEDGHGTVLAEDVEADMERYLGLHYPSTDIPEPARRLYRINPLRIIPDATGKPVRIVPELRQDTGAPLDLTFSLLRAVPKVHRAYLRNMGLQATMTMSLVIDGTLWGLVTCGHRTPWRLPPELRAACEVLVRLVGLQIRSLESASRDRARAARKAQQRALESQLALGEGLHALEATPDALLSLVGASGAAVVDEHGLARVGRTPTNEQLESLLAWVRTQPEPVLAIRRLGELHPPAKAYADIASGLLAVKIPGRVPEHVLWFRPEVVQEVRWGGDPEKAVEVDARGGIRPRRSFELWRQRLEGCSLPWSEVDLEVAETLRRSAIEANLLREVELEQSARRDAEHAGRARDELVSVVSHDLKSPLQVILLQCALIRRAGGPALPERTGVAIERIQRSAERMNSLIRDLLDMAKIEAGRFKVELRDERAERLVEDAVDHFRPLAEAKGVELDVEAEAVAVRADGERIFQVLSNLLSNAVKFTPSGGRVSVTARQEGPVVVFAVEDDGPGIPEDELPYVFDRYFQTGLGRKGKGHGLGLYIARGIVEAHAGRIWAECPPGRGCRFSFTLARSATREEPLSSWDGSGSSPHPTPGHS